MTRTTFFLFLLTFLAIPGFAFADLGNDLLLLTPDFTQTGTGVWQGIWEDTSGNGYNVFYGQAASYDGSSDPLGDYKRSTAVDMTSSLLRMRVSDGDTSIFNPGTSDYSVSFWYYQTDSVDYQHVITMGNTVSVNPGFSLHLSNGEPRLRLQDAAGDTATKKTVSSSSGNIAAQGWHHVVAVFDRTGAQSAANTVSLYVDTWLLKTLALDSTYNITAAENMELTLGGAANTTTAFYKGYLDDVAIYQGALSSTNVSTLYFADGIDVNTITTTGVTPIMIQNFETNLSVGFDGGLETTLDATSSYQATPVGNQLTIANDLQRGRVVQCPGVAGNCIDFGDPGATADDLDPGTGDYTVSFWFNANNNDDTQIMALKGNRASTDAGWNIYMEGGKLRVRVTSTAGDKHLLITSVTEDEWHHVTMVIDNENGFLKAYYDGQSSEVTEGNIWAEAYDGKFFTAGSDFSTDESLILGERRNLAGSVDCTFSGMLDDFAVWDRALTDAEILDIFSGATIPVTPDWTPGDANKDGKVDGSDVTILAGNWQVLSGASWDMGDFNGDGKVDGSDVTILAGNWQSGVNAAAASVPEPSTIVLLFAGITGLFLMRRR